MLSVSLDCPFLIALSVFFNAYSGIQLHVYCNCINQTCAGIEIASRSGNWFISNIFEMG
jgi:hypothetical protein